MLRFRPRYLKRYRRIADVLVRHGFGALVAQLGLDQALDFRQRLAPVSDEPVTRKTAAVHLREAIEELGPTFIKFGQIASTRPDMFPPEFINELAGLQEKSRRRHGTRSRPPSKRSWAAPSPNCSSSWILPRLPRLPWVRCTRLCCPTGPR